MPSMFKQISDSIFFTVRMPVKAFCLISVILCNNEPQRAAVMADRRMGMLQFMLRLAILLYILLFVMFYKKGCECSRPAAAYRHMLHDIEKFLCRYCTRVSLNGNMRLTLRRPDVESFRSKGFPDYCCNNKPSDCAPINQEPAAPGVRRPCWCAA